MDSSYTIGAQIAIDRQYPVFSVQKKDINAKPHPKSVNSVGRLDQEAVAGRKGTAAHEAHETCECRVRNSNMVSKNRLASRIGDAQEVSRSWTHSAGRLNLTLATLDQNEKNHDKENSCNNANNCWCIHAFSYFASR